MIELEDILRYKRLAYSEEEEQFLSEFLLPLIAAMGYPVVTDGAENLWVEVAPPEEAPFLFACHVDTHHKGTGAVMLKRELRGEQKEEFLSIDPLYQATTGCLGADDGVGIYCNLRMMLAGVKGTYLFTRGEEQGGVGAGWIGQNMKAVLSQFDLCVEVDREGYDEIITHQGMGKCASNDFAEALAEKLGMFHKPSEEGVYTDCAEFTSQVPECVNVAAGYSRQHTPSETVNVTYVEELIGNLINVDWGSLPIVRETSDHGVLVDHYGQYTGMLYDTEDSTPSLYATEAGDLTYQQTLDMVRKESAMVAWFLFEMGVHYTEIKETWEKTT